MNPCPIETGLEDTPGADLVDASAAISDAADRDEAGIEPIVMPRLAGAGVRRRVPNDRSTGTAASPRRTGISGCARRIVTLLFVIAAATATANAAPTWRRVESPHFIVWSDAAERVARSLLVDLELFRSRFLQFSGLKPEVARRISVIYFATDREFEQYKPRYDGRVVKTTAGFFTGSEIEAQMALAVGSSKRVVYHEFVHALHHELGWRVPTWFEEGSAELFSTFETDKNVAYFGNVVLEHVAVLQQQGFLPFFVLFTTTNQSAIYNEATLQGLFYAESWALVHYFACNDNPGLKVQFNAFVARLAAGDPPNDATFSRAFGVSMAEMQRRVERYMAGGSFLVQKLKVDREPVERQIQARLATSQEIDLEFTILDLAVHRPPDGAARLFRLAKTNANSARIEEAFATLAAWDEDEVGIREHLLRAVDFHTSNTMTYWYLARRDIEDWLTNDIIPQKRVGDEIVNELRVWLAPVLAANPDSLQLWDAKTRVEAFAGQPDPAALAEIKGALARFENDLRRPQTEVLLAFALKRLGRDDEARALVSHALAAKGVKASTRRLADTLLGDLARPLTNSPSASP